MRFKKIRFSHCKLKDSFNSSLASDRSGFTLIELMVSMSILVIIGGTAYTVFNKSIDIYRKQMTEMLVAQKCRAALNQIALDLSNLYAVEGDNDFTLASQDNPQEENVSQDMLTFVTLRNTRPDQFLTQLNSENEQAASESTASTDETQNLKSDLMRVLYMVGPDLNQEKTQQSANANEEEQTIYLLRMTTSQLNLEENEAVSAAMGGEQLSSTTGTEDDTEITPFIDNVKSLDFKYYDGEEWYDSWDETEGGFPKSIQITITVTDESGNVEVTESTQVYLRMAANFSAPSGTQAGGQLGGGGMQPGQM